MKASNLETETALGTALDKELFLPTVRRTLLNMFFSEKLQASKSKCALFNAANFAYKTFSDCLFPGRQFPYKKQPRLDAWA